MSRVCFLDNYEGWLPVPMGWKRMCHAHLPEAHPTMRASMAALGKAVRSAVSSGRHEITKGMRKTQAIG